MNFTFITVAVHKLLWTRHQIKLVKSLLEIKKKALTTVHSWVTDFDNEEACQSELRVFKISIWVESLIKALHQRLLVGDLIEVDIFHLPENHYELMFMQSMLKENGNETIRPVTTNTILSLCVSEERWNPQNLSYDKATVQYNSHRSIKVFPIVKYVC